MSVWKDARIALAKTKLQQKGTAMAARKKATKPAPAPEPVEAPVTEVTLSLTFKTSEEQSLEDVLMEVSGLTAFAKADSSSIARARVWIGDSEFIPVNSDGDVGPDEDYDEDDGDDTEEDEDD